MTYMQNNSNNHKCCCPEEWIFDDYDDNSYVGRNNIYNQNTNYYENQNYGNENFDYRDKNCQCYKQQNEWKNQRCGCNTKNNNIGSGRKHRCNCCFCNIFRCFRCW